MTNAELIQKIRKEIERLKDENNNIRCDSNKAYCQGYGDAFVDLLPFLSTLESEKPISPDSLEKEINRFRTIFKDECDPRVINEVASHFYELGKNSVPIPEDIILFKSKELFPEARKIYLWGYEDGKKQMIEGAVDAEVWGEVYSSRRIVKSDWLGPEIGNPGDKVHIIIVKED